MKRAIDFNTIKAIFIDLSGTIHISNKPIPGAIEACKRLFHKTSSKDVQIKFLTNTTTVSSNTLLQNLRTIGFDKDCIPIDTYIMTSVNATKEFLMSKDLRPLCLVESDLLEYDLKNVNFDNPNCVLVGLSPDSFNYNDLNKAFRLIEKLKKVEHEHPLIIAMHRANYIRVDDGELSLGPGAFIAALEAATGITAKVIGKPNPSFFNAGLSNLGVKAEESIMIGDDIRQDIAGSFDANFAGGILVRTGKYCNGDESMIDGVIPSFVADSFVEAVDFICDGLDKI